MFKYCIVVLSMLVAGGFLATPHAYAQHNEISPEKLEALLAASAELDAFFASHHRRLERASPADLQPLQDELTTEPKAILERHNLTSEDLAQWRAQLEAHGDDPTQAIEDPHFYTVVNRLLPRK